MKIVDVSEFYAEQGGGVRTYVNQKLQAAARAGHELVVIAPGAEDRQESRLGGRVLWVRSRPMPLDPRYHLLLRRRAVHALIAREQPDVLEGSSPWSGGWFAASAPTRAAKVFVFHQDPVAVYPQTLLGRRIGAQRVDRCFAWYWAYLRRLSAHYDLTVTSGHWLAQRLQRFGLARPTAVPFGIDPRAFSPDHADRAVRRQWLRRCGVGDDAALLVTVSRHHPEKRLATLIDAVRRVQRSRPVGLVIFGDGPLRARVERLAARVPGVHVAGFTRDRQQLASVLASADALLHGSSAETYGIAVAEALCSGLPVVVPDVGGAAELAGSSYAERYPAGDASACAAAVLRLLARDSAQLRAAAACAAGTRVASIDEHFGNLFRVYEAELSARSEAHSALKS